ncbi:Hpt domain-containing protein [Phenylobacterium deserti]|uniref:Hpt domain-containing protein n=1 Tax=Phenylobacterium deserti TaxID=1914756 RepID=UPI001057D1B1|nr:Hpt domain-containing protein [Phenylobacterium deserti]
MPQDSSVKIAPARVELAQSALAQMQGDLREALVRDVAKLEAKRAEVAAVGISPDTVGQLYMRAHDLKSLGATCGFPAVSIVAESLCLVIDDEDYEFERQVGLIDDHIDAIKALLANDARDAAHPLAARLLEDLRRDVEYR